MADDAPRRGRDDIDLREDEMRSEPERGRQADAPREIPPRGWLDVGRRVKDEAKEDNITLVAAGVAFYGLLSLAPALAAIVAIYGLVADPQDVQGQLDKLGSAIPADAKQVINDLLTQVVQASGTTKGISLLLGVVIALWSASSAMKNLMVALSTMYDEDEGRGFLKLRASAVALTLGAIVFVLVAVGLLVALPVGLDAIGAGGLVTALEWLRWPLLLLAMMGSLAVLYRVAPDRDDPRWRWTSWGAAIATVVWIVASLAFSFYSANFGNYSKTYGSMAVVVVTMLWLWITALCVLLGAEINAELERQTERDSTEGPEQPRGQRDAVAADTVAAPAGR